MILSKINLSKIGWKGGWSTSILIMPLNILLFFLEITPKQILVARPWEFWTNYSSKKEIRKNIEWVFKHSISSGAITSFFFHRIFLVKDAYPQEVMKKITPWTQHYFEEATIFRLIQFNWASTQLNFNSNSELGTTQLKLVLTLFSVRDGDEDLGGGWEKW